MVYQIWVVTDKELKISCFIKFLYVLLCFGMDGGLDTQKSVNWWGFVFGIEMKAGRSMMSMEEASKRRPFFTSPDELYDEEYYDKQSPEKKKHRLSSEQVGQ